ncbi:3900_t:CDS:2 [Entrophospora sp. SA101]|nr:3900_t:CDS:2 [Entrophospora sp. SA101]
MDTLHVMLNFMPQFVLRCPFEGLQSFCSVGNKKTAITTFWLSAAYFKNNENGIRPVGHHFMEVDKKNLNEDVKAILKDCTAKPSVLDVFSSLVSLSYTLNGIFTGIARATSTCVEDDWTFIPLVLAWTLPAICLRIFSRREIVIREPKIRIERLLKGCREKFKKYKEKRLGEWAKGSEGENDDLEELEKKIKIELEELENEVYWFNNYDELKSDLDELEKMLSEKQIPLKQLHYVDLCLIRVEVFMVFAFALMVPWIAVLIAYFTPPIGYGCRSMYFTFFCSIWSVNSILAYALHLKGNKNVIDNWIINIWFCFSGLVVAVALIFLVLLSHTKIWWVVVFGDFCSVNDSCTGT